MRIVSQAEFERWIEGARVLAKDARGEKVFELTDGRIVKLFRRKRLISSALLRPYAVRFAAAAKRLKALGFDTVKVIEVCRVPQLRRHGAVYEKLEGQMLREALADPAVDTRDVWSRFVRFVASLHERGVYFRAIHFANVLITGPDRFGLIDVSEARFYSGPLRVGLRARNFKPMLKYAEDAKAMRDFGFDNVIELYLGHVGLSQVERGRFLAAIEESGLRRRMMESAASTEPRRQVRR